MADHLDLPAYWNGHRARVGGTRHRVRLTCDQLESRDATGNLVGGVVAAAFGGPLSDSLSELARLIGDWAFLGGAFRTSQPAGRVAQIADESPRKLTWYDTWLDPDLLLPEEKGERGVRVTAPTPPADTGRGAFGDLLGEQPQLTGLANFGPFPSFVGVRAAPVFETDQPQSPRIVANGIGAPVTEQPTQTLAFGVRPAVHALELIGTIPNEVPEAFDDAVTVDEDGSVVFDPTANDTDPDYDDALWVKSVEGVTQHGRTHWEEGGLIRYIPDPDYENTSGHSGYEPDTFTYTVTDGLAEATGTVTVTVTSVNDAPVAANDRVTFINPYSVPVGDPDEWYDYHTDQLYDLLANDTDYDGELSHVEVDTTGATGAVIVVPEGNGFAWQYRWDFQGHTDIKYRVVDDEGAKSEWATVRFFADKDPVGDGPPPVASNDVFAVGDEEVSGSVLANDSGGSYAVLTSRPAVGRLTGFNTDGSFKYLADHTRGDATFSYIVFSANEEDAALASVDLRDVNLTIHHGGEGAPGAPEGGTPASELNERVSVGGSIGGNPLIPAFKATGAFTVANLNDSNVNAKVDASDPVVDLHPNYPLTSGEVDLMRLLLTKPTPIPGKNVTLTVTPPAGNKVQLWSLPNKGGDPANPSPAVLVADGMAATATFPVDANFPEELWVELCTPSGAVGDVAITMEYAGAKDTVSATGIWMKHNPDKTHGWPDGYFLANGEKALPEDADARKLLIHFEENGAELGQVNNAPVVITRPGGVIVPLKRTANLELSKFTTMPTGLTPYVTLGVISFDVTRSVEAKVSITSPTFTTNPSSADESHPGWLDKANDESPTASSDNDRDLVWGNGRKSTDNLYSIDGPGLPHWYSTTEGVRTWNPDPSKEYILADAVERANFFDFVRIKTGTQAWVSGQDAGVQGSRASVYYFWHSMTHLQPQGGPPWTTKRVTDPATPAGKTENEVAPGLININVIGG